MIKQLDGKRWAINLFIKVLELCAHQRAKIVYCKIACLHTIMVIFKLKLLVLVRCSSY